MNAKTLKAVLEVEAEGETAILDSFRKAHPDAEDAAIEAVKHAYRLVTAHAEAMPEGAVDAVAKALDGTAASAIATLSDIEKGKHKWIAQQLGLTEDQLKAAIAQAKNPDDEDEEKRKGKARKSLDRILKADGTVDHEVAEAYPEDVREEMISLAKSRFEQAQKTAELEKSLAAEKDARLLKEYVEKAAALVSLGQPADKLGPVLKAIDQHMPESEAKLLKDTLARTAKLAAESEHFKELGRSAEGGEPDTPYEKLKKAAEEIQSKEPSLSPQQAFAKALEIRKDLKAAYYTNRQTA